MIFMNIKKIEVYIRCRNLNRLFKMKSNIIFQIHNHKKKLWFNNITTRSIESFFKYVVIGYAIQINKCIIMLFVRKLVITKDGL